MPPERKRSASRQARAKRLAICEFCVVCVRPREHSAKPTHASATMRVLCKWSLCETQIIRLKHIHRICILRFSRDLCLLQVRNGEEGESLKEHILTVLNAFLLISTLNHLSRILAGGAPYTAAYREGDEQDDGEEDDGVYPPGDGRLLHVLRHPLLHYHIAYGEGHG